MKGKRTRAKLLLFWIFACSCAWSEPDRGTREPLEPMADTALSEAVPGHEFSGVILVAVNGRPRLRKAYGYADWPNHVPNQPSSRFMIFSSTKQFTAAAVLRLADRRKLNVQDPVSRYVDHWPEAWNSARLHHLLTHTSGIEIDTLAFWLFRYYPRFWPEPGEAPPPYEPKPLLSDPGSTFKYCNAGYTVLSLVVEKASGKPFAGAMKELVFGPLKMNDTGLEGTTDLPARVRGHNFPSEEYLEQKTIDVVGAGDIVTTVEDLLKWDEALYGKAFLSANALLAMFTPHIKGEMGEYGYGWIVEKTADGNLRYLHNGNGSGFRSYVFRRPDLHLYVAVLANREYPALLPQMRALEQKVEEVMLPK